MEQTKKFLILNKTPIKTFRSGETNKKVGNS